MRSKFASGAQLGVLLCELGIIVRGVRSTRLQWGALCIWFMEDVSTTCLTSFFQALASREAASLCWLQICAQDFL